jgi:hypothetical protein
MANDKTNMVIRWPLFVVAMALVLTLMGVVYANSVPRGEFKLVCDRLDRMESKIDRLLVERKP